MISNTSNIPKLIIAVFTAMVMAACGGNEHDAPTPGAPEDDVRLLLNFTTDAPATPRHAPSRAGIPDNEKHPTFEATAAERYINTSDMFVLLLDDHLHTIGIYSPDEFTVEETDGENRLKLNVNLAIFNYNPGSEVRFSIMVFANVHGLGATAAAPNFSTDGLMNRSAEEISKMLMYFNFNPGEGTSTWAPYVSASNPADSQLIPMSGLCHFTVNRAELERASTIPVEITSVDKMVKLQRCMAKIRVVDDLPEDCDVVLSGFELIGIPFKGAYLPDFELTRQGSGASLIDWTVNGTEQVEKATMLESWLEYAAPLTGNSTGRLISGSSPKTFELYIPEYSVGVAGKSLGINIVCLEKEDNETERNWFFNFADLEISDVTRNHVYEFTVTRESGSPAALKCITAWLTGAKQK